MRIYTKFGDRGNTALMGGAVVPKNHPRVEAYGAVDELNAIIGLTIAFGNVPLLEESLGKIQRDLFLIGAELASKNIHKQTKTRIKSIPPSRVVEIENEIDHLWNQLPPLRHFIIPGGSKTASLLHFARTVCRRAERSVVTLSQKEPVNPDILTYMNRVGDLLFVQARYANYLEKRQEVLWKGR